MPGHQKFEHAELTVSDVDAAVSFCTDIMGLTEIDRSDGVVYLGCGLDDNYDIAFSAGEPGTDHFATRVNEERLEKIEQALEERGIETERHDGTEPGQELGLRFEIPPGVAMEVVVVGDREYKNYDVAKHPREGITPLDADHITLGVPDVEETVRFLVDVLGFKNTEVMATEDGEWRGAFVRDATSYHDIGLLQRENPYTHHVAWEMSSIDHMKSFIDFYAQAGYRLESAIHRHRAGNNLAAYFLEATGDHMYEICAEEATIDPDAPTRMTVPAKVGYTAWGGISPPSHPRRDG